jgi:hypothetical protein
MSLAAGGQVVEQQPHTPPQAAGGQVDLFMLLELTPLRAQPSLSPSVKVEPLPPVTLTEGAGEVHPLPLTPQRVVVAVVDLQRLPYPVVRVVVLAQVVLRGAELLVREEMVGHRVVMRIVVQPQAAGAGVASLAWGQTTMATSARQVERVKSLTPPLAPDLLLAVAVAQASVVVVLAGLASQGTGRDQRKATGSRLPISRVLVAAAHLLVLLDHDPVVLVDLE